MPEDDKKFEAALAGFFHRESRDDAARTLCPDPELLAAYHQRALSPAESQAMHLHTAGCSRCQEVLAQLEATENLPLEAKQGDPADSTSSAPRTFPPGNVQDLTQRAGRAATPPLSARPSQWRWIAPAGAIAAALLLWIGYREMRPAQQAPANSVQLAENRKEVDLHAPTSAPSSATAKPVPQKKEQDSIAANNFTIKTERSDSSRIAARKPTATPEPQLYMAPRVRIPTEALDKATLAENTAPGPLPAQLSDSENKAVPAAAPAPAAKVAEQRATAYGDELMETGRLKVQVSSAARAMTNPTLILAPDASVMWRVGAAGSIEFSSTGGGEWQRQESGVSGELVSGFAPQKTVCWIVGHSGTILLTADAGATWRKITSPTNNDLAGVHATDALHAAVWEARSQKRFETADGGQTWQPIAGQ